MKIIRQTMLMLFSLMAFTQLSTAAKPDPVAMKKLVQDYLVQKQTQWKLTDADISNWTISNLYSNEKSNTTYLYVHQQVNGIRIFNAVSSVSIQDGKIKSFAKRIHADAAAKINTDQPSNTAAFAIGKTAESLGLKMHTDLKVISTNKTSNRTYYTSKELSNDKIRVELVYLPVNDKLVLSWDVSLHLKDGSHWWNYRIDAVTGEVLQKNDWTTHCDFGSPDSDSSTLNISATSATTTQDPSLNSNAAAFLPGYRVYALPVESPNFGNRTMVTNPSNAVASPYGWHDTNAVAGPEYTITRGNNVYAYEDTSNVDSAGFSPDGTSSLTFDYPVDLLQQPKTYLPASITNLFYVNNMVHDRMYHYGFDEDAGNFQENNYGHGGVGKDFVVAEAQDGGGSNNANFSTPEDGQNGWMQMYNWSPGVLSTIDVHTPLAIAGSYNAEPAGFGPPIVTPITADLVLVHDSIGSPSDACNPLLNGADLAGKIAVIDRGTCNFVDKVLAAQSFGAIAVLVVNNTTGLIAMGGNGNQGSVTIPSEMISQADGNLIKARLNANDTVNATLNPPPPNAVDHDGSLDNGVVIHEYGHGVSTRLTGGPANSNCLDNGEEGGEGWSDYFALLFTMKSGDTGPKARPMATYAGGDSATGPGIRRHPYSTDLTIDPETYIFLTLNPEVHAIGEVWCTVLWEMTWGLIAQDPFDSDWINGTGGNNIALRLVLEGLKLQPCGPGFIDGRDAILQADENLYNGAHKCIIWSAFAKRGMGFHADQGDPDVAGDETEDFSLAPICLTATIPPTANFVADVTNTCFGIVHFTDSSTGLAQSWRWEFGDGDTSIQQNPVHTYLNTGIYNVRLIVTNTLGVDTLDRLAYINYDRPATIAITGDSTVCVGSSTTLTSSALPGNLVEWRDANHAVVYNGPVYITPSLYDSTTFYADQYSPTSSQNVGPVDSALGTGGFSSSQFEGRLLFTALAPMRLKSAWVYSSADSIRGIRLYGPGGVVLQSIQVFIPAGLSKVELNFDIPEKGNYQVGVTSRPRLYRNTSGAQYPYMINGLVSITGSNSPQNATTYYFLYNWEVQPLPCSSFPVPFNVFVSAEPVSNFNALTSGLNVQFTSTSTGNIIAYHWDFGNGDTSNLRNPTHNYSSLGTYTVLLTVTGANGCQSVSAKIISITSLGISDITDSPINIYYSGNDLVVDFNTIPTNAHIRIFDPIGKIILNETFRNGKIFTKHLQNIASEFILVNVQDNNKNISKKIVLMN